MNGIIWRSCKLLWSAIDVGEILNVSAILNSSRFFQHKFPFREDLGRIRIRMWQSFKASRFESQIEFISPNKTISVSKRRFINGQRRNYFKYTKTGFTRHLHRFPVLLWSLDNKNNHPQPDLVALATHVLGRPYFAEAGEMGSGREVDPPVS